MFCESASEFTRIHQIVPVGPSEFQWMTIRSEPGPAQAPEGSVSGRFQRQADQQAILWLVDSGRPVFRPTYN
eukprot:COSAG02_NODE_276_length_26189_cov_810.678191_3_plen_72_part_00